MLTLTATSLSAFRRCRYAYWLRFALRLSRIRTEPPRRMGSAYHAGQAEPGFVGYQTIDKAYATPPDWADLGEWRVEHQTIRNLLAGYRWLYGEPADAVAVELPFSLRLPGTRGVRVAGRIDRIVRLPDGRLAVVEIKTTGSDIGSDSDYWLRLRADPQTSLYVLAARAVGHDVATVIYDVTRKPGIQPKMLTQAETAEVVSKQSHCGQAFTVETAVIDVSGVPEISVTVNGIPTEVIPGKKPGTFAIRETPEMYGARLLADITERPGYYYARREVPQLEDALARTQNEVLLQLADLRNARRCGLWYRAVGDHCKWCDYSGLCLQNVAINPETPPTGYEVLAEAHPELGQAEPNQ